jgi:DNA-directed RNA polymerase subunit omega
VLNDLKIDELLERVDSRYGLVVAAAKRARQINEYTATLGLNESLGIPGPQVHTRSQHPLSIAIEELRAGRLEVGFKERVDEDEEAEGEAEAAGGDAFLDPPGGADGAPDRAADATVDAGGPDGPSDEEGEGAA